MQDKHNIRTLSLNIKFICTRCETGLKSSLFCPFLKLVQINFIFTDNVRILYIYFFVCFFGLWQVNYYYYFFFLPLAGKLLYFFVLFFFCLWQVNYYIFLFCFFLPLAGKLLCFFLFFFCLWQVNYYIFFFFFFFLPLAGKLLYVFVLFFNLSYFTDYRSMGTMGRIAAFRLNFLGNTKIGRSIP